jgi:TolB-like protein/DNA-binding SARP family transcriptional activator
MMIDGRPDIDITLLGEPCVRMNGAVLPLPASRKTRALLVFLAMEPRAHSREALCDLLWCSNDDPRAGLRWSLTKLRPLLGDSLVADRRHVTLRLDAVATDLAQLRAALDMPLTTTSPRLEQFEAALHTGYLPGIDCRESASFELWLESQRASLRKLHEKVLWRLCESTSGDAAKSIGYARKRVAINHVDVEACLALIAMLLKYEGRNSARQCFEHCRERLQRAHIDDSLLMRGWRTASQSPPVRAASSGYEQGNEKRLHIQSAPQLPEKPSLAVLGFGDVARGNNSLVATGLTADLITRLSRVGGLFVIALASAAKFSELDYSFPEIGRLLGVRYLIHGSSQQHNARLRVNVELIEAKQAKVVWAESFNRSMDDIFLLQDELADAIVSAVEPEIERAEYERARIKPPENLDAWENYHMALQHSFRFTARDTEVAANYLRRALRQDPHFSRAHAMQSLTHFSRAFLNNADNVDAEVQFALASAERSVCLEARDAMGHWSLGRAQFLSCQHDLAISSLDRALQANHNYALGHYAKGFVGSHSGLFDTAIPSLERAERLSPFDPLLFAMKSSRAVSLVAQGDYQQAAAWAVRATLEPNAHFHIHAIAAACLQLAGRHEDAKLALASTLARHPGYSRKIFFRSFPNKNADQERVFSDALLSAGLA